MGYLQKGFHGCPLEDDGHERIAAHMEKGQRPVLLVRNLFVQENEQSKRDANGSSQPRPREHNGLLEGQHNT